MPHDQNRLEDYIYFDSMEKREINEKIDRLILLQQGNAAYFEELKDISDKNTKTLEELQEKTEEILSVWETTRSVGKFLAFIGRVGKWLASISIFAVIAAWLYGHKTQ